MTDTTDTPTLHDCPMCDTFPYADPMDLLGHIKSAHAAGMALTTTEPLPLNPDQVLAQTIARVERAFPGTKNGRFESTTTPWGTTTTRKITDRPVKPAPKNDRPTPPTSAVRIRCGACKDTHASVAEVKSCSGAAHSARAHDLDADSYKGPNPYAMSDGRKCNKCKGSGIYGWGACVNGKMSFSGPCFACAGKGTQTDCGEASHATRLAEINAGRRTKEACCDRVRNDLYWTYGVKIYL